MSFLDCEHVRDLGLTRPFFPAYVMPVTTLLMNWNSVILVGVVALTALWWFIHAREHYPGPKVMGLYIEREPTADSKGS